MRALGLLVLPSGSAGVAASTWEGVPAVTQRRAAHPSSGYAPNDEVHVRVLDGTWQVLGRGALRGIQPVVTSVAADGWGSSRLELTLRRDPSATWPDLFAFTDVDYYRDGVLVWSGRIRETPTRGNADQWEIAVSCEGWQAHLDDDLYRPLYVSADQGAWRDVRDLLSTDLAVFTSPWQVSNTDGGITISLAKDVDLTAFRRGGVIFDAGPDATVQRLAGTVSHGDWEGAAILYAKTSNTLPVDMTSSTALRTISTAAGTAQAISTTFGTPGRYVLLFVDQDGTALTGDANWLRFDSLLVAGSTAYESGGASTLTADDVVVDALSVAPLLDQATSQIGVASFAIPSYAPQQYVTPREAIDAANAYEGWSARVDRYRRLWFAAYPTDATIETLGDLDDSAPTSVDDVYTRVLVETTDGAGVNVTADRATTSATFASRRGVTRAISLSPSSPMTTGGANRVGDIYLAEAARAPMRGTITIRRGDCRAVVGGRPVEPSELLLRVGENLRLARYRDPLTGASHRDARIVEVDYDPGADAARVSLDATRNQLDTLLARYAAVVGG